MLVTTAHLVIVRRMGCGASAAVADDNDNESDTKEENGTTSSTEGTPKRQIVPLKKRNMSISKLMSRRRSNSVIRITDYTGEGKRGNRQRSSVVEGNTRIEPLGSLGEGKINMSGTEFHQHAVAGSAW